MDLPQVMENTGSLLGEKKQENYSVALILRFVDLKTLKYSFDLWKLTWRKEAGELFCGSYLAIRGFENCEIFI